MTRTEVGKNAEIKEIKISQVIYLEATEPYRLVLKNREKSDFKIQLNQLLKNGLIIYKVLPEISQS
jgi:hypothetical protein